MQGVTGRTQIESFDPFLLFAKNFLGFWFYLARGVFLCERGWGNLFWVLTLARGALCVKSIENYPETKSFE